MGKPALHDDPLPSWNDGPARDAITRFVESATAHGPGWMPPEARVAVFDNDGTLWCEKPMPIQLDFILRQFAAMAEQDPALRSRQPWKAAHERDYAWLSAAMVKHYHGDDGDLKVLIGGLQQSFGGMSVDDYEAEVEGFLGSARHPTLDRPYRACTYRPMVELLRYLEVGGFATFIASGGDRDFMRPAAAPLYGIPADRVIGSSFALRYREDDHGGAVIYKSSLDVFDDGPEKRYASGAGSAAGRSSLAATPTGTCRCCSSPAVRRGRRCACWCCTTTPSASSTTPRAPRRRWSARGRGAGRWSA
jgi:FMN phosphatase YigB (HAD superfamily)